MILASNKRKKRPNLIREDEAAVRIQNHWRQRQATIQGSDGVAVEGEDGQMYGRQASVSATRLKARARMSHRRKLEDLPSRFPMPIHKLRVKVYLLMNDPSSSLAARMLSIFFLVFILFSVLCFLLETHPKIIHKTKIWRACEIASTVVFTLEYVMRLSVCTIPVERLEHLHDLPPSGVWQFISRPMNICDICAVLPFYVQLAVGGSLVKVFLVFRAVRLVRLFKILKMGGFAGGLKLICEALSESAEALSVLMFFLLITVVLSSSTLYYFERMGCPDKSEMQSELVFTGSVQVTAWDRYQSECRASGDGRSDEGTLCCNEDESPLDFPSIPHAFWWSVVTMTTVGFGDLYPRTWQGRIVGIVSMLAGILLIALPVAIIGRKFQDAYEAHELKQAGITIREKAPRKISSVLSMADMSRRLRLMELEPEVSLFAQELADLIEESESAQKYIEQCETSQLHKWQMIAGTFEKVIHMFDEKTEEANPPTSPDADAF